LRIGIGLPNPVLDVPGRLVVAWARRAEERGFSSLATIDRIAYPSYDSLTVLTAAAAATERIGLLTNILLEPVYSPVLLAKVTASLDRLSDGRLTLGLGVGGRPDDYQLAGRPFDDRGRRFDADLELLHTAWAGQPVAGSQFPVAPPATRGRIPLLIGGQAELAGPRAARWDAGFTVGGAPPEMAAGAILEFRKAWEAAAGPASRGPSPCRTSRLASSTAPSRSTTSGPTTGSSATGPSGSPEAPPAPPRRSGSRPPPSRRPASTS
jgi:alkanesulfonate monooxygenase SsuD/methylene tetrahydromethanopterin reductase-like flavin-dependent oxidoreductase (luciferase family)